MTAYRPHVLPAAAAVSTWPRTAERGIAEIECALCLAEIQGGEPGAPERVWSACARVPLRMLWPRALDHLLHVHGVVLDTDREASIGLTA